jgi:hypothetical protein
MKDEFEHTKAGIQAKVEQPFRVIKRQFGHVRVRDRGLAKNTAQLQTLFALSNLWLARGKCHRAGAHRCVCSTADGRRELCKRRQSAQQLSDLR